MNKIINIQGLRGVAVLLVAFSHLFRIEEKYGGQNSIIPDFILFGVSGVDIFFVISGFVIVSITRGNFEKPMEALRFIYHRGVRIYPVYWFYSVLVLIVFLVRPTWINNAQDNRIDIVSSFLLIPQKLLPLVNVGWSLVHELYFYGIFFLLMLLIREKFLPLALAIWGFIVISSQFFVKPNDVYLRLALHPLTLEFIGGCFVAIVYYQGIFKHDRDTLLKVLAISFMLLIVGHEVAQFVGEFYSSVWWWRVLTYGVPSVSIVYCLVQLETFGYFLPNWLIVLGDASYSIYLSHVLILSALGRVWHEFSSISVVDNLIAIPILIILMLYLGLLSYNLIERPLMKFFRKAA
jgi:peptidoglycan/LPS O-acetylase OafA/YrhL